MLQEPSALGSKLRTCTLLAAVSLAFRVVFAPSESIASLIGERGVRAPISVIPTGVDVKRFACGDGAGFRTRMGIPAEAFVVGHVGRLAPEKNLGFLAEALALYLKTDSRAHILIAGECPA